MKIKTLSRSVSTYQPPGQDVAKVQRNLRPEAHPFERAREYQRALNAVKLERLFAAPFLAQLGNGHVDGVYSMAKDPQALQRFASGSGDGIVKVWDLSSRAEMWSASAHENVVKGMAWTHDQKLLTCGADRYIKLFDPYHTESRAPPIAHWMGPNAFTALSMHRSRNAVAAASSAAIKIYDLDRQSADPEEIRWPTASDTITDVAFNPVETSILGSVANDRSVVLYDVRTSTPVLRTVLNFASNRFAWNPMEAMNFAVANEDHNIYVFDARKFDRASNILKGHVHAVMDCEFDPTGQEIVSASYDRTIRIFKRDSGHSRDIYHTKRMQRVFRAMYTSDSHFILSGSDDGNVRLWRTNASERRGIKSARQRQAQEYNETLIDRYSHMPEIKRIKRHRRLPKVVKKAQEIKGEELAAIKRRDENERKHTKKQFEKRRGDREKMILAKEQ